MIRSRQICQQASHITRKFSSSRIKVERIETGIVHVQLSRPDKLNALDMKMFESIADTAKALSDDKSVRAIILSGEGRAFCSGLDVKSMGSSPFKAMEKLLRRPAGTENSNLAQDVAYLWRQCPVPVIACLHGVCFGGGLQIAAGADFRFATPDCKMSIMEAKWGLIPDMSGSITFRELVKLDVLKELTMTARQFDGNEALTYGLVTRVVEKPFEEALQLARDIKTKSPDSICFAKQLYQETHSTGSSERASLMRESELQESLLMSFNQMIKAGNSVAKNVVPLLFMEGKNCDAKVLTKSDEEKDNFSSDAK